MFFAPDCCYTDTAGRGCARAPCHDFKRRMASRLRLRLTECGAAGVLGPKNTPRKTRLFRGGDQQKGLGSAASKATSISISSRPGTCYTGELERRIATQT